MVVSAPVQATLNPLENIIIWIRVTEDKMLHNSDLPKENPSLHNSNLPTENLTL